MSYQTKNEGLAAIDIGSNSVRLLLCPTGGKPEKYVRTTKLSQGFALTGKLCDIAARRTLSAIEELCGIARSAGIQPKGFATEAVRSAGNGQEFCRAVLSRCGFMPRVLTGQEEALCAFLGVSALFESRRTAVLDIGGASSELCVGSGENIVFSHSLKTGVVKLQDSFGRDYKKTWDFLSQAVKGYGEVADFDVLAAVGGTATTLAAYDLKLEPYDPLAVHMSVLTDVRVLEIAQELFALPAEEVAKLPGIHPSRADVIAGGALLLYHVMRYINAQSVTVSESDNLEGFLLYEQTEQTDF